MFSTRRSVKYNRLFLTLFGFWIFPDTDDKIKIERFNLAVFFHQDCSVSYLLDYALIMVIAIKRRNEALFVNKFFGVFLQILDTLPSFFEFFTIFWVFLPLCFSLFSNWFLIFHPNYCIIVVSIFTNFGGKNGFRGN